METLRLNGTGWRLQNIYLCRNGISTTCSGGAWTILPSLLTTAGCWVLCRLQLLIIALHTEPRSGSAIDPAWFALDKSRALDDPNLKIYMRATVFVSEYLAYVPALIIFLRRYAKTEGVNVWEGSIALVAILLQPGTILIDHGHFQYNTVMLGFAVATLSSMIAGRPLWGCVFFVGALGFKQMALFYAPAVFAYLLGICLFPRINIVRFLSIALVTVAAFAVL